MDHKLETAADAANPHNEHSSLLDIVDRIIRAQDTITQWDVPPTGKHEISPTHLEATRACLESLSTIIASGRNYLEICITNGTLTYVTFNRLAEKGIYIYANGTFVLSSKGFTGKGIDCKVGEWVIYEIQNGCADSSCLENFKKVQLNGMDVYVYVNRI